VITAEPTHAAPGRALLRGRVVACLAGGVDGTRGENPDTPAGGGPAEGGKAVGDPGGDPACWLHQLCPECGAVPSPEVPGRCWRCGHPADDGCEPAPSGG
jgi:hypothetical protein